MASKKHITVQQYEPLNVPSAWKGDEVRLVQRLTALFDDIYKRYGRLGLDDISKAFSEALDNIRGNVAAAQETASQALTVANSAWENAGNASMSAQNAKDTILPVGAVFSSTVNQIPKAQGNWAYIGTSTVGTATLYHWKRTG